eukprot:146435_1
MVTTLNFRSIMLFLITLRLVKAQNYTIPYGTNGLSCADGYSLSVLQISDDILNIELIDECTLLSYSHIANIGDNCYLYQNKYTSNEVIGYIDAALNTSITYVTLNVNENYEDTNNILINIIANKTPFPDLDIDLLFIQDEISQSDIITTLVSLSSQLSELRSYRPVTFFEKQTIAETMSRTSGSWNTIELNDVLNDDNYITLDNGNIKLEPGYYAIQAESMVFQTNWARARLTFDNINTEKVYGSTVYGSATSGMVMPATIVETAIKIVSTTLVTLEVSVQKSFACCSNSVHEKFASTVTVKRISHL